jgi:hypothetical protein
LLANLDWNLKDILLDLDIELFSSYIRKDKKHSKDLFVLILPWRDSLRISEQSDFNLGVTEAENAMRIGVKKIINEVR